MPAIIVLDSRIRKNRQGIEPAVNQVQSGAQIESTNTKVGVQLCAWPLASVATSTCFPSRCSAAVAPAHRSGTVEQSA